MIGVKKFFKAMKDLGPIALKPSVKNAKGDFFLMLFSGILQAVLMGVNVIIQAYFFQKVNEFANGGPVFKVSIALLIFIFFIIIEQVANAVVNYSINKFIDISYKVIESELMKKLKKLKPIFFESPDNLLKLSRARQGAQDAIMFVVLSNVGIIGYIPFFIIVIGYMATKDISLALVFPILLLPAVLAYITKMKITVKMKKETTEITRVRDEYRNYIIGPAAKEMRMGGFFKFLYGKYKTGWSDVKRVERRANFKIYMVDTILAIISASAYAGVIYLIIRACLLGDSNAGFLAATISSIEFMFGMLEEFFRNFFAPISERYGGIEFFVNMMNEKEYDFGEDLTDIERVEVKDLSFKYPNQENFALEGVSFDLKKDQLLAVVGENGSGKSTLLKLVLGLFENDGSIKYYDKDKKEIINPRLREKSSAIFQDFYKYKMKLDENIKISDLNKDEDFRIALDKAGLSENMKIFPEGGETMLSREFEGVDLSGGQWQRVSIARGVYRDKDIIAFDEPTAAIDPLEESALYNKLKEISRGKIGLLITHRIGSARIADSIIVMDKGLVVEHGTHEELMDKKGKYYEMVQSQAEWYK